MADETKPEDTRDRDRPADRRATKPRHHRIAGRRRRARHRREPGRDAARRRRRRAPRRTGPAPPRLDRRRAASAAAPVPDLAGKTTIAASAGRRGRAKPAPAAAKAATRDADDTSPLLNRRAWMALAWGAFSAASAAALAATGRFMFPNVLNEPPQQFKAGFPNEYGIGVDERWKEKFGIWIVRIADETSSSTAAASTR